MYTMPLGYILEFPVENRNLGLCTCKAAEPRIQMNAKGNPTPGIHAYRALVLLGFFEPCGLSHAVLHYVEHQNRAQTQNQMWVEGAVLDQIETERSVALSSALTPGTTVSTVTPTGMPSSVTLTTVIAKVSGYGDLYSVQVTGSWSNELVNGNTTTVTVTTYMRAPHV